MIETKIYKSATAEERRVACSSALIYARWRSLEGCPRVAGFDAMTCLQIDLLRWERKNFGLQPSYTSALGVIEEVGELEDAQDDEDEWADAIGDIMIYACNLCSKNALDFGTMMQVAYDARPAPMVGILGKLGKLAHVVLKADQGIRHYADRDVARRDIGIVLYRVVSSVVRYATMCGHDPREIMAEVAREVMKREWWANPGMGVPIADNFSATNDIVIVNDIRYEKALGESGEDFRDRVQSAIDAAAKNERRGGVVVVGDEAMIHIPTSVIVCGAKAKSWKSIYGKRVSV